MPAHRFLLLPLMALLTFGPGVNYDIPASVGAGGASSDTLQSHFRISHTAVQSLYTVYSFSNVPTTVVLGGMLDKSLHRYTLIFAVQGVVGTALFAVAVWADQLWLLFVSRVIYGIANEALVVAMTLYIARWYRKAGGLALGLGICQAFQRGAVSLNFLVMPRLAESLSLHVALFVGGAGSCLVTLLSSVLLVILSDRWSAEDPDYSAPGPPKQPATSDNSGAEQQEARSTVSAIVQRCCGAVQELGFPYAVIQMQAVSVFLVGLPFIGIAKLMFLSELPDATSAVAASYVSLYQLFVAIGQPLFGFALDKTGHLSFFNLGAAILLLCATAGIGLNFSSLVSDHASPQYPLVILLAIAFSATVQTVRPALPSLVPSSRVGLAMGMMASLIGLATGIFRLVLGSVMDANMPPSPSNSSSSSAATASAHNNESFNSTTASSQGASSTLLPTHRAFTVIFGLFAACALLALVFSIVMIFIARRRNIKILVGRCGADTSSSSAKNNNNNASGEKWCGAAAVTQKSETTPLILPSRPKSIACATGAAAAATVHEDESPVGVADVGAMQNDDDDDGDKKAAEEKKTVEERQVYEAICSSTTTLG